MKQINGNYGSIIFDDCRNQLKTFQDNEFDLCITDPPWNVEYEKGAKIVKKHHGRLLEYKEKEFYTDKLDFPWYDTWFFELLRISKCVCLYLSATKYIEWIQYHPEIPCNIMFHYFNNGHASVSIFNFSCYNPIVVYKKPIHRFDTNVIAHVLEWGFLNTHKYLHPTPKSSDIYKTLIQQSRSQSVIDPFAGSGTVAEAGEALRIKYLGIELDVKYQGDIKYRIQEGIKQNILVKKLSRYES